VGRYGIILGNSRHRRTLIPYTLRKVLHSSQLRIALATLLLAEKLLTPLDVIDDAALLMEDGNIVAVGTRGMVTAPANAKIIDFGDAVLAPGLIDIHIHGGAGHDVMEGSDASLAAVEWLIAKHGVTSYCPTTVTAPVEKTLRSLELLGKAAGTKASDGARARPVGIHLEGPFLSHSKRGVHPPELLQPASIDLFERMWQAAGGRVNLLTIAPEIPGALELIAHARSRGVCVSLGHSNADFPQSRAGFDAGARHATHTFNAMRALDHREPGILGAVLTDNRLTADMIVDGIHVAPPIVDLFVRTRGVDRAVLITDATSATGMPDGTYSLGGLEVQVHDGRCESDGRLAGSVLTLDRAVRNTMDFASVTLQHAIRMATYNPACVLGIEKRKGVLAPGADADIAVFTPRGELIQTIVAGIIP
jgi:N-acetylglucosamine-6-phosphate deacetylase